MFFLLYCKKRCRRYLGMYDLREMYNFKNTLCAINLSLVIYILGVSSYFLLSFYSRDIFK